MSYCLKNKSIYNEVNSLNLNSGKVNAWCAEILDKNLAVELVQAAYFITNYETNGYNTNKLLQALLTLIFFSSLHNSTLDKMLLKLIS